MCFEYLIKLQPLPQGRRVAQAQAQQQAEITFTESLEVVSTDCFAVDLVRLTPLFTAVQVRCLLRVVRASFDLLQILQNAAFGHFYCSQCL